MIDDEQLAVITGGVDREITQLKLRLAELEVQRGILEKLYAAPMEIWVDFCTNWNPIVYHSEESALMGKGDDCVRRAVHFKEVI